MKTVAALLLAGLVPMSVAASIELLDRFRVDGIEYCVPRSAAVRGDLWWVPKDLPKDGFAFQLRGEILPDWIVAVDLQGKKRAVVGFVVQQNSLQTDSARIALARRAADPGVVIERDNKFGLALAYESRRRDHWIVWRMLGEAEPNADSLERAGVLVAICGKPSGASRSGWKGPMATCQRRINIEHAQVGYSFDAANLPRLEGVDEFVKKQVTSWRCSN